jgi:phage-related protein
MKSVVWLGGCKEDLSKMPSFIKNSFGYRLRRLQMEKAVSDIKPLFQLGRGVYELRESFDTNAYRLVYVVNLKNAIYVLDVFMKKSKSGIGLPKPDAARLQARFKQALQMDEEAL